MKQINKISCFIVFSIQASLLCAQTKKVNDTAHVLTPVIINAYVTGQRSLGETEGTYLHSGKKSETIYLSKENADITNKIARQVFAKLPGIFVYDMDGAGNQVNIASRGLDPHRGWEFNIRKDGILTNSDMYGYPASHYSMPLESIEKIELVRGTGSLQYGAQFGGMLNYISKKADTTKPFSFEAINTIGSYNLLSSFNAIGGTIGKIKYYAYVSRKSRDGYRVNEHTDSDAEAIVLTYEPNQKLSIRVEWARSTYTYRIPGPLTDAMFYADPRQATRSRNYFSPDIHVPSVNINWQIGPRSKIQFVSSAVLGKRNSVMFDKPTNIADTIVTATMQYNNRQVDIDRFKSYTNELRLLHNYSIGQKINTLVAGIQYMNNDLHRRQIGKGTTGSDFDLTLIDPTWGRDVHLKTTNIALFAENKWQVLKDLSITAGARIEMGKTDMSGTINYYPANQLPVSISHEFPLYGAGFTYAVSPKIQFYGGWSQAYHPMVFKDLIPSSLYEKVDPYIRDASGYNAEIGFRGNWLFLKWDVTAFLLEENNRFGTLAQSDASGTLYTYRTNIGNSLNKGIEMFIQGEWQLNKTTSLSLFTSTAFMRARYKKAIVKSGNDNLDIKGNKVESAPDLTTRNGITLRTGKLSLSALYSYTSSTFADALNIVVPPASTGAVGLVPAYGLLDMNAGIYFLKTLELKISISNLANKQYFTKRPMFYPGPGVWPSEGRNFSASLTIRM
ncbi:MAG: TonB-dependent receptor [Sediminibacterium sp.]|nr:TonB-dependent receptor [Sediminibacterium sp.]